ncbi:MAG: methyltransferase domain-containing protein [Thermaerobacter sp.]|nr:methyltransferase domain-containing protein [Thermaerobacter sp.]
MSNGNISSLDGLDRWLSRSWAGAPQEYQWLLLQTLATAASRRAWIASWPGISGEFVLDLGCGPGVVAQEIAVLKSCRVIGYDIDANVLDLAQNINRLFDNQGRVKFRLGDILEDAGKQEATLALVRFVAQYVGDLDRFFLRVHEHIQPGGYLAIEDIDDGYLVEYPEPPQAWQHAVRAFQTHQNHAGDRYVGRKLAEAGTRAGLVLEDLTTNPSVYAGPMTADDLSVQFDIDRIGREVPAMIRQGLLTEQEWFEARSQYRATFPHFTYISTATVRLLFRVP